MRRNTAYCSGVLVEFGLEAAYPFYEKLVKGLAPYFDIPADKKDELDYFAARYVRCVAAMRAAAVRRTSLGRSSLSIDE